MIQSVPLNFTSMVREELEDMRKENIVSRNQHESLERGILESDLSSAELQAIDELVPLGGKESHHRKRKT